MISKKGARSKALPLIAPGTEFCSHKPPQLFTVAWEDATGETGWKFADQARDDFQCSTWGG